MRQFVGIILLIGSLFLGYTGINKVRNSGGSVEVLGVELSASDESTKTTGVVMIGLAVVGLIGGGALVGKKG